MRMIFDHLLKKKTQMPDSDNAVADSDVSKSKRVGAGRVHNFKAKTKKKKRVVHTRLSFHPKGRRSLEEQVNVFDVIKRPVITEKAANQSERGVYVFVVRSQANKHDIVGAVEAIYGVRPKKVHIAKRPSKRKRIRIPGREREYGMTSPMKKAYVFLREGDKINLT